MPIAQKRSYAASGLPIRPERSMVSRTRSAMPIPALPAPKTTTRWSSRSMPVTSTAARIAASTTAAVPWMSSLKVQTRSR